ALCCALKRAAAIFQRIEIKESFSPCGQGKISKKDRTNLPNKSKCGARFVALSKELLHSFKG
ncbi:MAG: hypothetical protein RSC55_09670, partial [Oscillospiraceae bacterium]